MPGLCWLSVCWRLKTRSSEWRHLGVLPFLPFESPGIDVKREEQCMVRCKECDGDTKPIFGPADWSKKDQGSFLFGSWKWSRSGNVRNQFGIQLEARERMVSYRSRGGRFNSCGSHWTYHRWGCYHRACSGPGCHFMNLAFSAAVHDRGNEMQLPFPHWIRMKRASWCPLSLKMAKLVLYRVNLDG